MIDIHSHALPFVDDGASSMEEALKMIEKESACGVTDLFLTPHYMRYHNYLATPERIREVFGDLISEVQKRSIDINLYLGNEIYYTIEVVDLLRKNKILRMGKTNMVLVEFAVDDDQETIAEAVHNLVAIKCVPIIAHVERYKKMHDYKCCLILKRMGALIQVNAATILGYYGKPLQKRVFALIKKRNVDFVASDIHDEHGVCLKAARDLVLHKFGRQIADSIFDNRIILG
jgi:protein-tyrosine phosphatase